MSRYEVTMVAFMECPHFSSILTHAPINVIPLACLCLLHFINKCMYDGMPSLFTESIIEDGRS